MDGVLYKNFLASFFFFYACDDFFLFQILFHIPTCEACLRVIAVLWMRFDCSPLMLFSVFFLLSQCASELAFSAHPFLAAVLFVCSLSFSLLFVLFGVLLQRRNGLPNSKAMNFQPAAHAFSTITVG